MCCHDPHPKFSRIIRMMVVWFGDVVGGVWLRPLMNIDKKGKDDDEPLLPIFCSHSGSASR